MELELERENFRSPSLTGRKRRGRDHDMDDLAEHLCKRFRLTEYETPNLKRNRDEGGEADAMDVVLPPSKRLVLRPDSESAVLQIAVETLEGQREHLNFLHLEAEAKRFEEFEQRATPSFILSELRHRFQGLWLRLLTARFNSFHSSASPFPFVINRYRSWVGKTTKAIGPRINRPLFSLTEAALLYLEHAGGLKLSYKGSDRVASDDFTPLAVLDVEQAERVRPLVKMGTATINQALRDWASRVQGQLAAPIQSETVLLYNFIRPLARSARQQVLEALEEAKIDVFAMLEELRPRIIIGDDEKAPTMMVNTKRLLRWKRSPTLSIRVETGMGVATLPLDTDALLAGESWSTILARAVPEISHNPTLPIKRVVLQIGYASIPFHLERKRVLLVDIERRLSITPLEGGHGTAVISHLHMITRWIDPIFLLSHLYRTRPALRPEMHMIVPEEPLNPLETELFRTMRSYVFSPNEGGIEGALTLTVDSLCLK